MCMQHVLKMKRCLGKSNTILHYNGCIRVQVVVSRRDVTVADRGPGGPRGDRVDRGQKTTVYQEITGFLSLYYNQRRRKSIIELLGNAAELTPDALCLNLQSLITEIPLHQLNRHHTEYALCRLDAVNKDHIIIYLKQHLASTAASICLQHGMQIRSRIWSWYSAAIDTDVASTRLKLASMLYCNGDPQMAAEVLEDVERFQQIYIFCIFFTCMNNYIWQFLIFTGVGFTA